MFCYQCEQTAKGEGCTKIGVCGKQPEVADLQDLLIYALKGLAMVAAEGRRVGITDNAVNVFTVKSLFSTLTNVNFDEKYFLEVIRATVKLREDLKKKVSAAGGKTGFTAPAATFTPAQTIEGLLSQAATVGLKADTSENPDIQSLKHTLQFGIKGICAYADHAQILGQEDDAVYAFVHDALTALTKNDIGLNDWIGLVLKCGEANLRAMELLDAGNTGNYGHPVPTTVPLGHKKGKAILISGHDLKDLDGLLKQTEGKGILSIHMARCSPPMAIRSSRNILISLAITGRPGRTSIKNSRPFPGAILMTTNCIQRPAQVYSDNLFTCRSSAGRASQHVETGDFSPVIAKALALPGFTEDSNGKSVMVGFARNTVLGVAGKVIEAVKGKQIRHFFLVAGCDGAKPGRNYYTEFVEKVPEDCIVLTLACGKYRFFDKDLGTIGGIPRLMDVGQCNDAYSAIQIAVALAKAFDIGVNDLPLSMILSWYEQKAVAILLILLHLGIKNIRLGPSLPAFLTPEVLDVLVKTFDIKPITTPDEDLKAILG